MSGTKAVGVALAIVGVAAYSYCRFQEGQQQGQQGQQQQLAQLAPGKQQLEGAAWQAGGEGADEGRPLLQQAQEREHGPQR
jgi:hypothetical protein